MGLLSFRRASSCTPVPTKEPKHLPLSEALEAQFDIYMLCEGFIGESGIVWDNSRQAIWRISGEAFGPVAPGQCIECRPRVLI